MWSTFAPFKFLLPLVTFVITDNITNIITLSQFASFTTLRLPVRYSYYNVLRVQMSDNHMAKVHSLDFKRSISDKNAYIQIIFPLQLSGKISKARVIGFIKCVPKAFPQSILNTPTLVECKAVQNQLPFTALSSNGCFIWEKLMCDSDVELCS